MHQRLKIKLLLIATLFSVCCATFNFQKQPNESNYAATAAAASVVVVVLKLMT